MSIVKSNCFEKTKVRWGIFKKLSPTKIHSEQAASLAANVPRLCDGRQSRNLIINRELSGGYCKTDVSRWPFSQHK